jgi:hypothetical protein
MAKRRITITLDEDQLARICNVVRSGRARNISGFVQHAASVSLDDVAGWGTMLTEALTQTGGDLAADEQAWDEQAWDDRILGTGKHGKRPA